MLCCPQKITAARESSRRFEKMGRPSMQSFYVNALQYRTTHSIYITRFRNRDIPTTLTIRLLAFLALRRRHEQAITQEE